MKKSLSIIVTVFATFIFSSCIKTYTCECTDSTGVVVSSSPIRSTKLKAKTTCEQLSVYSYESCKLK